MISDAGEIKLEKPETINSVGIPNETPYENDSDAGITKEPLQAGVKKPANFDPLKDDEPDGDKDYEDKKWVDP